ncbi:S-layer homology domain-containing protein [Sporosarcina sp. FA9]|uniref:S-layer homology domain-containing protein n=1 Tax=Sporosarcina sp. FA9 TaxID=3413030 RepID=UPI003F65E9CF
MKKSNSHKILKAAMAATVATGAIVVAAPTFTNAETPTFKDVNNVPADYFYAGVTDLAERGVINGYPDGTFKPYNNMSREHAAKVMALALGLDLENVKDPGFTDVPKSNPYYAHIAALVEAKIISGYENGTFGPKNNLTRAQMAKIIVLGFEFEAAEKGNLPFTDVKAGEWHEDFITTLYANEITTGTTATTFSPNRLVTRGQMAAFINRSEATESADGVAVNASAKLVVNGSVPVALGNYATANDKLVAVQAYVNNLITDKEVVAKVAAGAIAGEYTVALTKGDAKVEKTIVIAFEMTANDRFVTEVNALNATQIEVKFSTAVDSESVLNANGTLKANIISLTSLDGVPANKIVGFSKANLSADGKSLTITATTELSKRYDIKVDNVKTVTGQNVDKYEQMISIAADKTAPTILGVERLTAATVKVKFSEPMSSIGTTSFKYADGTSVAGVTNNFVAGADEIVFTMASEVTVNKEIIATFIGARDQAGNLISPNPGTASLSKISADGVAPTVSTITQTGATTFAVKFSERVVSAPTVKIGADTAASVTQDKTDPTIYNVTSTKLLDGATTVVVSNFEDLSGEQGTTASKVVTFVKDTNAPKVLSSTVLQDSTNGKEYLVLALDKDVKLDANSKVSGQGTFIKNFVTSSSTPFTATNVTYKDAANKKIVQVELNTFLGANDVEGALYSIDLTFANVMSDAKLLVGKTKVAFTRGNDIAVGNAETVAVNSVVQSADDNNKVNVTFDKAVDGATATNPANYTIGGVIIESVTLLPAVTANNTTTQVAVLNLKANSSTFTGSRNVTIANVKALGSTKAMETYFANTVMLNENVAPTVTLAKLTSTKEITLTFSEGVNVKAGITDFALVSGVSTLANAVEIKTEANGVSSVVLTLKNVVTDANIASGLSLEALSTINVKDAVGNNIVLPTTIQVTR